MDIVFKTKRLEKQCNSIQTGTRAWGADGARRVRRRLDDLRAAENLEVMRRLPGRCHELRGEWAGVLSLDLRHPYRLLFEPADEPVPVKADGGLDWASVTTVRILGIEDTHE
ncbi:MAG: killer suppression protein [Gemmatimonadota bacterium]|uniref:killer suppression protein n=1 Tax=Candidatus Palauibacter scopulicola TaxID=3056741 RepID=UPI002387EBF1|nr:killer suppression protein [Candidatus Palauibacter scopulicola]